MNAADYLQQQLQLLARGRAWSRELDSITAAVLQAFGDGAARFDAHLLSLLNEADPREADELIDTWERMAGLPDPDIEQSVFLDERQAALWQKVTQLGGQTEAYFIEVADRLGCLITIKYFPTFHAGSYCGMPAYGEGWKYVWQVTVETAPDGTANLEAVLRRLKPSHTAVIFAYAEGIYPNFYYDFRED